MPYGDRLGPGALLWQTTDPVLLANSPLVSPWINAESFGSVRRVSTFLRQTRRRNHCVVVGSSFGWLIHTIVGSAGGSGGLRTKRSGCSA
jgi:hypothetical protein